MSDLDTLETRIKALAAPLDGSSDASVLNSVEALLDRVEQTYLPRDLTFRSRDELGLTLTVKAGRIFAARNQREDETRAMEADDTRFSNWLAEELERLFASDHAGVTVGWTRIDQEMGVASSSGLSIAALTTAIERRQTPPDAQEVVPKLLDRIESVGAAAVWFASSGDDMGVGSDADLATLTTLDPGILLSFLNKTADCGRGASITLGSAEWTSGTITLFGLGEDVVVARLNMDAAIDIQRSWLGH